MLVETKEEAMAVWAACQKHAFDAERDGRMEDYNELMKLAERFHKEASLLPSEE